MELTTKNIIISAVCLTAIAGVGYAVYFDHKRRNDKKFQKTKKEVEQENKVEAEKKKQNLLNESAVKLSTLYNEAKKDVVPEAPAEREAYLYRHLTEGEAAAQRGPSFYEQAACSIFKAIVACPNPVELVLLTEKMLPKPCYEIVISLFSIELKAQQEAFQQYYTEYPPAEMNIKFEVASDYVSDPNSPLKKYYLVAAKDFQPLDKIYTENPISSSLEPFLEGEGFCGFCMKQILNTDEQIKSNFSYCRSVYCSSECHEKSKIQFPELKDSDLGPVSLLTESYSTNEKLPILLGKVLFRVFREHEQALLGSTTAPKYTDMQHIERVFPEELNIPAQRLNNETYNLQKYLGTITPGIEHVVDIEYVKSMKAKIAKGAFAFSTVQDTSVTVPSRASKEPIRRVTSAPTTATALYLFSAYLAHDDENDNVQTEFMAHNHELTLVAKKAIKKGEILRIAHHKDDPAPLIQEETKRSFADAVKSAIEEEVEAIEAESKPADTTPVAETAKDGEFPPIDATLPQDATLDVVDNKVVVTEVLEEPATENEIKPVLSYADAVKEQSEEETESSQPSLSSSQEFVQVEGEIEEDAKN